MSLPFSFQINWQEFSFKLKVFCSLLVCVCRDLNQNKNCKRKAGRKFKEIVQKIDKTQSLDHRREKKIRESAQKADLWRMVVQKKKRENMKWKTIGSPSKTFFTRNVASTEGRASLQKRRTECPARWIEHSFNKIYWTPTIYQALFRELGVDPWLRGWRQRAGWRFYKPRNTKDCPQTPRGWGEAGAGSSLEPSDKTSPAMESISVV